MLSELAQQGGERAAETATVSSILRVSYYVPEDNSFVVQHGVGGAAGQLVTFMPSDSDKLCDPLRAHMIKCMYPWPPAPFYFLGRERQIEHRSPVIYDSRAVFLGMTINSLILGKLFEHNRGLALYNLHELTKLVKKKELGGLSFRAVWLHYRLIANPQFSHQRDPFNMVTVKTPDEETYEYLSRGKWVPHF